MDPARAQPARPALSGGRQASGRLGGRIRGWLPEGRSLPETTWRRRHTMIVRFALLQAVAIGAYGLVQRFPLADCAGETLLVVVPALLALLEQASRRLRTISATVSLMFACAVAVDFARGVTEAHFLFFVMIGVVALYQDWTAFIVCLGIVVVHHAVLGSIDPSAVYAGANERAHPIEWALIHGAFVLAACVAHLVAWKANEQQELSDPLTRLANRVAFTEELDRALQAGPEPVSVIFVDLDDFKQVNDSAGHRIGDEILVAAARRMLGAVRDTDLVARLGGDEFAVVVPADADEALTVAERLLDSLTAPVLVGGRHHLIRASVGVADSLLAGSRRADDLVRDADLAMYGAKSAGKDRVAVYRAGVDQQVRNRATLAVDIQQALQRGELELYYQPVVRGASGSLVGAEALLRWHHPVQGLVSPDLFIPLAEETGAIHAIGAWVLSQGIGQLASWQATLPSGPDLSLAVNVSPVQLDREELVANVDAPLRATGLDPSRLTLEVTESVLVGDLDRARLQLAALRQLGCKVAIDDFGTGYSSLAYLSSLPVDTIKIDRSFIAGLTLRAGPSVLVQAVVDMARALHLNVVAEGVEDQEQQAVLNHLCCPLSQGYLYSPPVDAATFARLAARWPEPAGPDPSGGLVGLAADLP